MAFVRPAAAPRRPRARLRSWHRWLGLGFGVWFALVGASGTILVFEDPIDAWLNPQLLTTSARGAHLGTQQILERAQSVFPLGHAERLRLPASAGEVYRLTLRTSPRRVGAERAEASFDPVSGAHLGTRSLERLGLGPEDCLRTLYEFHRNVLLGGFGSNLVGVAGTLLLVAALAGLTVAFPRHRADWSRLVRVKIGASATRVLFDIHRSVGASLGLLLLLAAGTGLTLVYLNYVRELVALVSPVASFPTMPWRTQGSVAALALEQIEARVRQAYPQHRIAEIHLPSKPTAGYLFYLRDGRDVHRQGDTLVWLHPASGDILLERGPRSRTRGEAFMHWLLPLHSGSAFGLPGRIAMAAAGVAPLVLVLSGLAIWSAKRRSQRIEARRRADVPTRAGQGSLQ